MDKDKNLPDVTKKIHSFPKDMTAEHYHGMNLLPGSRVGDDYKLTCTEKLTELYVQGFLLNEEYSKRVEWVNAAQTRQQIDVVFLDLQKAIRELRVKAYLNEDKPVKTDGRLIIGPAIFAYLVLVFCLVVDSISGSYFGAGILIFGLFLITGVLTRGYRKHRGH